MRGPGIQQFADEPDAITLFKYALGTDVIFSLLEKNPEQKQAFDDYMAARRVDKMPQWFEIYPSAEKLSNVRDEPGAVLMVDVGGGPGQELARFKNRHPNMSGRMILQDLPLTLQRIEKLPDGIEPMEYDFFTPQPIKGRHSLRSHLRGKKTLTGLNQGLERISCETCCTTGPTRRVSKFSLASWRPWTGITRRS